MRKIKQKLYIALFIITALVLLAIYGYRIEPNLFVVTRHQLNPEIVSNHASLKIVQVSDLHLKKFSDRAQKIAEQVNQLQPDIVVFTGDSIDRAEQIGGYDRFLSLLDRQTAKYAILGNWEYKSRADLALLKQIYTTYNCQLLVNESVLYKQGDRNLLITGIDDLVSNPDLIKSLQNINPNPNHLLLAHSPANLDDFSKDELQKLAEYKPQYMLTGHTHGGQISFFGFAPIRPPRSGDYVSGWYQINSLSLYVSRGLGISVLPMRIGAVPEIGYFEWFLK
ncbi:metallophosphoesterase [Tumidithrix elongata RA019]|uniref:Metallophosphoesterase n=1 Tax=Tumidithrix elongata BACA0141 TaxID=2716417 RepID=A0AAW9PZN2_9CYAN|nr:metallophosphoesterase [Tumidithrix elongata RA019]